MYLDNIISQLFCLINHKITARESDPTLLTSIWVCEVLLMSAAERVLGFHGSTFLAFPPCASLSNLHLSQVCCKAPAPETTPGSFNQLRVLITFPSCKSCTRGLEFCGSKPSPLDKCCHLGQDTEACIVNFKTSFIRLLNLCQDEVLNI